MANKKKESIPIIHTGTLKVLLEAMVNDWNGKNKKDLVNLLFRNLKDLGTPGKIALHPSGHREFYSPYATIDMPYDLGRMLYILEG